MPGKTPVTFALSMCSVQISSFNMTGFAPGDALTIEFPNDDFDKEDSSDGLVTFIMKHQSTADGVIRLGQGNALIAIMRQLHEASLAVGGLTYQFSCINLKSPDEMAVGKLMFKKRLPIKWGDAIQHAEIPFFLVVEKIAGGTITPS